MMGNNNTLREIQLLCCSSSCGGGGYYVGGGYLLMKTVSDRPETCGCSFCRQNRSPRTIDKLSALDGGKRERR